MYPKTYFNIYNLNNINFILYAYCIIYRLLPEVIWFFNGHSAYIEIPLFCPFFLVSTQWVVF